jgi:hypothetical protein
VEGEVDIVRESAGDERTLVASYGPGDFFGERAAMMAGSRTANGSERYGCRGRAACIISLYEMSSIRSSGSSGAGRYEAYLPHLTSI